MMRRFYLQRNQDLTGVSGVGRVAEGIVFSTGWVALTWLTEVNSLVFYPSIENVEHIHGHGGATEIVWLDLPTTDYCTFRCADGSSCSRTDIVHGTYLCTGHYPFPSP